ncbi:hypothetical protein [Serinicoccus sp. LYQ131]|uniref:hypothetical protein n=1 Tax=Serinicoccus sp. LYQ131 TaxID=3378797 RepID=UPI003852C0AB
MMLVSPVLLAVLPTVVWFVDPGAGAPQPGARDPHGFFIIAVSLVCWLLSPVLAGLAVWAGLWMLRGHRGGGVLLIVCALLAVAQTLVLVLPAVTTVLVPLTVVIAAVSVLWSGVAVWCAVVGARAARPSVS